MSRVRDRKFWMRQAVSYFHPLGIFKFTLIPVQYLHGYNDPSAFHLPILWDNEERPLFKTVEKFRFGDEHVFDFRGIPQNTLPPRSRTLADSNERGGKGFVPTYAFTRDFGAGESIQARLDFRETFYPGSTRQRAERQVLRPISPDHARAQ